MTHNVLLLKLYFVFALSPAIQISSPKGRHSTSSSSHSSTRSGWSLEPHLPSSSEENNSRPHSGQRKQNNFNGDKQIAVAFIHNAFARKASLPQIHPQTGWTIRWTGSGTQSSMVFWPHPWVHTRWDEDLTSHTSSPGVWERVEHTLGACQPWYGVHLTMFSQMEGWHLWTSLMQGWEGLKILRVYRVTFKMLRTKPSELNRAWWMIHDTTICHGSNEVMS